MRDALGGPPRAWPWLFVIPMTASTCLAIRRPCTHSNTEGSRSMQSPRKWVFRCLLHHNTRLSSRVTTCHRHRQAMPVTSETSPRV